MSIAANATARYAGVRFFEAAERHEPRPARRPLPHAALAAMAPTPEVTAAEDAFLSRLLRQAGLRAEAYRRPPLHRRLRACLRALGAADVAQATLEIQRDPQRLWTAVAAVLIGVTSFHRGNEVFAWLARHWAASWTNRAARPRVWSVGCSDGSELYTVAMLLADAQALEGSELVGIDCRPQAIAAAQAGLYTPQQAAALPWELQQRHLLPCGDRALVSPVLRQSTGFAVADALSGPAQADAWDLVLCRNLSIYLTPDAAADLWRRMVRALRPGGVLVVGTGEQPDRNLNMTSPTKSVFVKP